MFYDYQISWKTPFEPYLVGQKDLIPEYCENFVDRGHNKKVHAMELAAMG